MSGWEHISKFFFLFKLIQSFPQQNRRQSEGFILKNLFCNRLSKILRYAQNDTTGLPSLRTKWSNQVPTKAPSYGGFSRSIYFVYFFPWASNFSWIKSTLFRWKFDVVGLWCKYAYGKSSDEKGQFSTNPKSTQTALHLVVLNWERNFIK